jgi:hypothetical protein
MFDLIATLLKRLGSRIRTHRPLANPSRNRCCFVAVGEGLGLSRGGQTRVKNLSIACSCTDTGHGLWPGSRVGGSCWLGACTALHSLLPLYSRGLGNAGYHRHQGACIACCPPTSAIHLPPPAGGTLGEGGERLGWEASPKEAGSNALAPQCSPRARRSTIHLSASCDGRMCSHTAPATTAAEEQQLRLDCCAVADSPTPKRRGAAVA